MQKAGAIRPLLFICSVCVLCRNVILSVHAVLCGDVIFFIRACAMR